MRGVLGNALWWACKAFQGAHTGAQAKHFRSYALGGNQGTARLPAHPTSVASIHPELRRLRLKP
eukprot:1147711-Pelagomonas_calceolata.AAC.2